MTFVFKGTETYCILRNHSANELIRRITDIRFSGGFLYWDALGRPASFYNCQRCVCIWLTHENSVERNALFMVVWTISEQCIGFRQSTYSFCSSRRDMENNETVFHIFSTCPALYRRSRIYFDICYVNVSYDL